MSAITSRIGVDVYVFITVATAIPIRPTVNSGGEILTYYCDAAAHWRPLIMCVNQDWQPEF
ncbi:hypothetical protein HUU62_08700 [Rhodoferax sp. 4810]|nr:hypothetical protein [Rhodoferax jenense]